MNDNHHHGNPDVPLCEDGDCYRTLFEDATDGLLVADSGTGRFVLGNPRICAMLGYTSDELMRLSVTDIHPPERLEWVLAAIEKQTRGEQELAVEIPVRRKDGTEFAVDIAARQTVVDGRTCFMGIFRDATERLEAERALRYSEAKLRQSQRLARLGHYELDVANGEWVSSAALDELFGIDAGQAKNVDSWIALVHPEDRAAMMGYLLSDVVGSGSPFDREYRIVRLNDGAVRWVHGLGELELSSDGRVKRMFGVIQDITERKHAEDERQRFESQVQQSQKLESLGLLAGGIAHDFNNLLFGIVGNAELAMADTPEASPAYECLQAIVHASRRAADLCRQLLAYAGKSQVEVCRLDLHALLSDTNQMLALAIPKRVTLNRDFAATLPVIEVDATQLGQVIMNLVLNASESIGERGGVVTVSTGTMECSRELLDACRADPRALPGTYVYFEVADTGGGMDESTVARMFEPFFSTKFAGRGLGLAAVLGIVRGHNGGIMVRSVPDVGTVMRVLLPACDGSLASEAVEGNGDAAWRGDGTVLVVDDEDLVRQIAQRYLERLGFSVMIARDGEEAVGILQRALTEGREEIACVLLDLTMPRMDGAETLARVRDLGLEVPILLSSGYDEHDLARRFRERGVTDFVQKPYRLVDLANKLRTVLQPRTSPDADVTRI